MREDGGKSGEHAVGSFADGEYPQVGELAKVVGAAGATQRVARKRKTTLDGKARVNRFEGAKKDIAGEVFAVHGGDWESIGGKTGKGGRGMRAWADREQAAEDSMAGGPVKEYHRGTETQRAEVDS